MNVSFLLCIKHFFNKFHHNLTQVCDIIAMFVEIFLLCHCDKVREKKGQFQTLSVYTTNCTAEFHTDTELQKELAEQNYYVHCGRCGPEKCITCLCY